MSSCPYIPNSDIQEIQIPGEFTLTIHNLFLLRNQGRMDTIFCDIKGAKNGTYPFTGEQSFVIHLASGTAEKWIEENLKKDQPNAP